MFPHQFTFLLTALCVARLYEAADDHTEIKVVKRNGFVCGVIVFQLYWFLSFGTSYTQFEKMNSKTHKNGFCR